MKSYFCALMICMTIGAPLLSAQNKGAVQSTQTAAPTIVPATGFRAEFLRQLEDVGKKYDQLSKDRSPDAALAEAFEKGMEALPFLNKVFGSYVPRPNWSLRWDGVEKVFGIGSFIDHLSLDHAYASVFRRDFQGTYDGSEKTVIERVNYGFSPLASVNATFKDLLKGSLTASFRMNATTTYDLNLASTTPNITETFAREM